MVLSKVDAKLSETTSRYPFLTLKVGEALLFDEKHSADSARVSAY